MGKRKNPEGPIDPSDRRGIPPGHGCGTSGRPCGRGDVATWERRVVGWLRDQWGDDLAAVVRHTDEKYAHLHAYILPGDAEMRARRLHPGVSAKEAAKSEAVADGADAKTANGIGNRVYRAAMREMQDGFWRSVGIPCQLTRIGPARRRLTRAAWHAEKAGVAAAAEAIQVTHTARMEAEAAKQEAASAIGAAEQKRQPPNSCKHRQTWRRGTPGKPSGQPRNRPPRVRPRPMPQMPNGRKPSGKQAFRVPKERTRCAGTG